MDKDFASNIAREAMEQGANCCQAILTAANQVWNLNLPPEIIESAVYFREGMSSGCTCGALVGLVLASGMICTQRNIPADYELPKRLHLRFKTEFRSSCCAVIRKKQSFLQRVANKGCIDLTARSAAILVEEWEDHLGAGNQDICNYSNL